MEILKNNYHIISTILFLSSIIIAHIFATNNYEWTKNTISDLGAQGYERKLIMQIGFLAFGLTLAIGIELNGLSWRTTPILIYAICVGLTGVFCTKPFFNFADYSTTQSTIHSIFAQIAGITFSVGILVQLFFSSTNPEKFAHLLFFILIIGFSALFGLVKEYQGVFQRLLYLASFIWLIKIYKP